MNADAEHPYAVTPADLKNVAALVEANPDSEASRFANVNWYRVASGSLFGAAMGGVIHMLHRISRGRRRQKV